MSLHDKSKTGFGFYVKNGFDWYPSLVLPLTLRAPKKMLGLLWSLGKVAFVGCIALHTHMHVTIVVPTHEVTFMH